MSERKVLTKYYPPDFDPAALGRSKKPKGAKNKLQTVRLMAPFSMKCTSCGHFIGKATKFNARKEVPLDEKYLSIQIFRFYIRCSRCSSEIVFRTDPKTQDYAMVRGAVRNIEPWHNRAAAEETDEERLRRLEAEDAEEDAADDPMQSLEAKTRDAQEEMAVADALDRIRMRNAARSRMTSAAEAGADEDLMDHGQTEQEKMDELDALEAKKAFERYRATQDVAVEQEDETSAASLPAPEETGTMGNPEDDSSMMPPPPPPPMKRPAKKKKKDFAAALGIKKKII
jgi:hypothetical protein